LNLSELTKEFYKEISPPPDLNVWQWADARRVLSSEASAEPGPWRTDRFPFTREIMFELSPQSDTEEVVLMGSAQIAKTECMLNWMGHNIDVDPGPMLYTQKTIDAVTKFSMQRFKKSLEASPSIAKKLPEQKSRDDSNTKLLKNFPGGLLVMGGMNSAASLRSMPISKLALDEIDSYEMDIQEEGDPIELAIVRTRSFARRKIFYASTPLVKETSKIEPLFEVSDQRFYNVPCPHCGTMQTLKWANIKYKKTKSEQLVKDSVYLQCEHCKKKIKEHFKTQMLADGEWIATHPGRDTAGFHINALYSPLGFFSWDSAVKLWLKHRRTQNRETLRVFINTVLGETFSEISKIVDFSVLYNRRENYKAEVPAGVMVITAGVDVQDDRIEVEVLGTGQEEENWSLGYERFMGDPEYDNVWNQLDKYLLKQWKHESGIMLNVACTAVDSGYKARIVYNFCKKRFHRRIFPVKGTDGWGRGLINRPNAKHKDGVWLVAAYVDELKTKIYSQLKTSLPGPSYCHFPEKTDYDSNYFRMLTAEKLTRPRVAGQYKLKWVLPAGRRNEALDCRAYAIAALNILNPKFETIKNTGTPITTKKRTLKKKRRVLSKGI